MKNKFWLFITTICIFVIVGFLGWYFIFSITTQSIISPEEVEEYVRENINDIAPENPVLGGSWYVTELSFNTSTNTGFVAYEDGHIAGSINFYVLGRDDGLIIIQPDHYVTLEPGKTKFLSGITITLNKLVADYRCPIDVDCVEGGAITVNITLEVNGKSITLNKASDEVPLEWEGYKISITKIEPSLITGQAINPNDYRITFKVEKLLDN